MTGRHGARLERLAVPISLLLFMGCNNPPPIDSGTGGSGGTTTGSGSSGSSGSGSPGVAGGSGSGAAGTGGATGTGGAHAMTLLVPPAWENDSEGYGRWAQSKGLRSSHGRVPGMETWKKYVEYRGPRKQRTT